MERTVVSAWGYAGTGRAALGGRARALEVGDEAVEPGLSFGSVQQALVVAGGEDEPPIPEEREGFSLFAIRQNFDERDFPLEHLFFEGDRRKLDFVGVEGDFLPSKVVANDQAGMVVPQNVVVREHDVLQTTNQHVRLQRYGYTSKKRDENQVFSPCEHLLSLQGVSRYDEANSYDFSL